MAEYFRELGRSFVEGWSRFWFGRQDLFALGLVRLLTGALLFWYLATLLPSDLDRLLSNQGFESTGSVKDFFGGRTLLHWMDELQTPTAQLAWHAGSLTIVLLMTVGLFSRITTPLAWLVALAYFHRLVWTTGELEPMLALVLLYLSLGPSGTSFSLDAVRAGHGFLGKPEASLTGNLSLRLLQVHLTGVYLMMALGKFAGGAWWEGNAVWWLIAREETRLLDLTFMSGQGLVLLEFWTHVIAFYQLAFPVMVWSPRLRPLWLVLGIPVWVTLGVLLGQLEFAAIFLVAGLAFIPGETLRGWFASKLAAPQGAGGAAASGAGT